jgi:hypothetical protein
MSIYESYAIYAEQTDPKLIPKLGTEEMRAHLVNRIFNKEEVNEGIHIKIADDSCERIELQPGTYRINGLSFLTMINPGSGVPPVPPIPFAGKLTDIYPGYCVLYDVKNPPKQGNMSGALCLGTMATAYDTAPSLFDCVVQVLREPMQISLGHQCSYENHTQKDAPAFLRVGDSDYHVSARMAIFKIS